MSRSWICSSVSLAVFSGPDLNTEPSAGGASSIGSRKTMVPSPYRVKCGTRVAAKAGMTNPPPSS